MPLRVAVGTAFSRNRGVPIVQIGFWLAMIRWLLESFVREEPLPAVGAPPSVDTPRPQADLPLRTATTGHGIRSLALETKNTRLRDKQAISRAQYERSREVAAPKRPNHTARKPHKPNANDSTSDPGGWLAPEGVGYQPKGAVSLRERGPQTPKSHGKNNNQAQTEANCALISEITAA